MQINQDGSYSFNFDNGEEGPRHSGQETRTADGTVVGQYTFEDGEGAVRLVQYRAGKDGFVATGNVGVDPEENVQLPPLIVPSLEGHEEKKVIPGEPLEESKEPIFEASSAEEEPQQDEFQQSASETREKTVQDEASSEEPDRIDPTFPLVVTGKRRLSEPKDAGVFTSVRPSVPGFAFSSQFIPAYHPAWYGIPQYYYVSSGAESSVKDKPEEPTVSDKDKDEPSPIKPSGHSSVGQVYVIRPQTPVYDYSPHKSSGIHPYSYPVVPGSIPYYIPAYHPQGVHPGAGAHVSTIVHHQPGKSGYTYHYGY